MNINNHEVLRYWVADVYPIQEVQALCPGSWRHTQMPSRIDTDSRSQLEMSGWCRFEILIIDVWLVQHVKFSRCPLGRTMPHLAFRD